MTRATASALLALLLALGLAGCGDDGDEGDKVSGGETSSSTDKQDADGQDESDEADDADEGDVNPAEPVFTDGPGDTTLTFTGGEEKLGTGYFDRSEVEIGVGQVVEFQAGDGGTYAVKVGGLDGVTIHGGLKEYYRFDVAGTYTVEEDLSGATASIVVD